MTEPTKDQLQAAREVCYDGPHDPEGGCLSCRCIAKKMAEREAAVYAEGLEAGWEEVRVELLEKLGVQGEGYDHCKCATRSLHMRTGCLEELSPKART